MFKKIVITSLLTTSLFILGCSNQPTPTQQQHNLLLIQNTNWTLTHIGTAEFKADDSVRNIPNIQFNQANQNIQGTDGCNRIMGTYEIQGEQIHFRQLAHTKMLCGQGNVSTLYNEALARVAGYQVYDKTLRLLDRHGNPVLQFSNSFKK